ncbi:MAG: type II toxin-antitoxin system HicB family antitoxin [Geminicoccaceae bacterium]
MLEYPVELNRDTNGTLLVTFPEFAEAVTFGEDESDALLRAVDALETVLAARMDDREDIPLPSPAAGRPCVVLPALTAAKVLLYRAMREAGVRKADLARRLGWHGPQIDRLLDLNHASRLDQIEAALAALGKRLSVDLADVA